MGIRVVAICSSFAMVAMVVLAEPRARADWFSETMPNASCPNSIMSSRAWGAVAGVKDALQLQHDRQFKSYTDIQKYMACYAADCKDAVRTASPGSRGQNVNTGLTCSDVHMLTYEANIARAAKNFDAPKDLMTCLMFRESQMDSRSVSFSGAKGVAQLLPGAVNEINAVLDPTCQAIGDLPPNKRKAACEAMKAVPRNEPNDTRLREAWESTLRFEMDLRPNTPSEGFVPRRIGDGVTRGSEMRDDVFNPDIAIAGNALYLKRLQYYIEKNIARLKTEFNATRDQRAHSARPKDAKESMSKSKRRPITLEDYYLFLAAAYNCGPTAFAGFLDKILMPPKGAPASEWGTIPDDWITQMGAMGPDRRPMLDAARPQETVAHVGAIQNCMKKNNWNPPNVNEARKDCSKIDIQSRYQSVFEKGRSLDKKAK
jgi:hypothetical protein